MNEMDKLQRRLIPINIAVAILALLAAITLIFAPLLTINVGKMATAMVEAVDEMDEDSQDTENNESSGGFNFDEILESIGDLQFNFSTYSIAKLAFSDNPLDIVIEMVVDGIRDVEDDLIAVVITEMLPSIVAESEVDIDTDKIDVKDIMNKMDKVITSSEAEQDAAIEALVSAIQSQVVTTSGEKVLSDDMKDSMKEMIEKLMDNARDALDGEKLTLESFICVTISMMMNDDLDVNDDDSSVAKQAVSATVADAESDSSEKPIYTNYNDLFSALFGDSEEGEGESGVFDQINDMFSTIQPMLQYFVYVMFFFAGIWFIQFLFAFIHIFTKNKRFTMWYTKLFGFIPCLIFGVGLIAAKAVVVSVASESAAMITAIFGAISSTTWISGACYIALWIISIFLAFPIKRKIRKLKKQEKLEKKAQQH